MAIYNNGFPMTYQQMYQQYYQQPNLQPNLQQNLQNLQPNLQPVANQIQNGGFISVRSEDEARNYPIAYGNSITFKDETAPYVYVKTMGFSQLDRPVFEKFRLVKESDVPEAEISDLSPKVNKDVEYVTQNDLKAVFEAVKDISDRVDALETEVDDLKTKISEILEKKTTTRSKS